LFYKIGVGELDEETSIWMSKSRCGVPDIIREGNFILQKCNADIQGAFIRLF